MSGLMLAFVLALILIVIGVAMFSIPAGFIAAGLAVGGLAWSMQDDDETTP